MFSHEKTIGKALKNMESEAQHITGFNRILSGQSTVCRSYKL